MAEEPAILPKATVGGMRCIDCDGPLRNGQCPDHPWIVQSSKLVPPEELEFIASPPAVSEVEDLQDSELAVPPAPVPPPSPAALPRDPMAALPRTTQVLIFLVVLALLATAFGWFVTSSALSSRDRSLQALSGRLDGASQQLKSIQHQMDALGQELSSLEARAEPDLASVAKRIQQSVYVVETRRFLGSSFVVRSSSKASLLITNFHVVEEDWNAGLRTVSVIKGSQDLTGTILKVDPRKDLAVVRVNYTLPALELEKKLPKVGDPVVVVGSPFGLEGTVANGIVSHLRDGLIQFSAPVSPGDSGGPLVDREGKVIGVTRAKVIAFGAEGLSFAIPIRTVCHTVLHC